MYKVEERGNMEEKGKREVVRLGGQKWEAGEARGDGVR